MAISEDAAAVAAATLTSAHIHRATAGKTGSPRYEALVANVAGLYRRYFEDIKSGAILHDAPPP